MFKICVIFSSTPFTPIQGSSKDMNLLNDPVLKPVWNICLMVSSELFFIFYFWVEFESEAQVSQVCSFLGMVIIKGFGSIGKI